jgi:hypothetical protein
MWKGIRAADIAGGALRTFGRNAIELFVPYFLVGLATGGIVAAARWFFPFGVPYGSAATTFFRITYRIPLEQLVVFFLLELVILLSANVLQALLVGGVAYFGVRRFRGEEVAFGDALRAGLHRFPQIVVASLVVGLATIALYLVPILIFLSGAATQNPLLALIGFAALVIDVPIAFFLGAGLALYAPIIMLENPDPIASLRRSWALTRGRRGAIFGAQFLVGFLAVVLAVPILSPAAFLGDPVASVAAEALLTGIVGSWSILIAAAAYDLIVRPRVMYNAPPFAWPGYGPPASAAWGPPSPPRAPPSSPPPG